MTLPRTLLLANVNQEACERLGLDAARVASIARRLSRAAKEANAIGLIVFGAAGTGLLRKAGGGSQNDVAALDGHFDGGDGGDEY